MLRLTIMNVIFVSEAL